MKRTIRINASALKNATCMLRFYRLCIEGYKSPVNSNAIEFGSAVHLFLSSMAITGGDLVVSLALARKYFQEIKMVIDYSKRYLDDQTLCNVCVQYWSHLQNTDSFKILSMDVDICEKCKGRKIVYINPLEVTDKGVPCDLCNSTGVHTHVEPAVEVTFSNKFYEDDDFIVLLEGTIDKIGKFDNGCFALGDYKTTSIPWGSDRKQKLEAYFRGHEISPQLRFYRYNIELKAKLEPSTLMTEITARPLGCFIDGIFTSSNESEFKRSRIYFFSDEDMLEFENMLKGFVSTVITILKGQTVPPRHGVLNGACAGGYKPCQFLDACLAPGDIARAHVLKNNFIQNEYLPIRERE